MYTSLNQANELSRRRFMSTLARTTLGVGVGMPFLQASAAELLPKSDKKLIFLYMAGGMSHIDTFDPQPGTDEGGPVQAIKTNADGVMISEFFPNLASQMDKLAIIRSMYSTQGAHSQGNYYMHTGYQKRGSIVHPTLGSWAMKHQGKINPTLPGNVVIAPSSDYPYAGFLPPELGAIPLGDAIVAARPGTVLEAVGRFEDDGVILDESNRVLIEHPDGSLANEVVRVIGVGTAADVAVAIG